MAKIAAADRPALDFSALAVETAPIPAAVRIATGPKTWDHFSDAERAFVEGAFAATEARMLTRVAVPTEAHGQELRRVVSAICRAHKPEWSATVGITAPDKGSRGSYVVTITVKVKGTYAPRKPKSESQTS